MGHLNSHLCLSFSHLILEFLCIYNLISTKFFIKICVVFKQEVNSLEAFRCPSHHPINSRIYPQWTVNATRFFSSVMEIPDIKHCQFKVYNFKLSYIYVNVLPTCVCVVRPFKTYSLDDSLAYGTVLTIVTMPHFTHNWKSVPYPLTTFTHFPLFLHLSPGNHQSSVSLSFLHSTCKWAHIISFFVFWHRPG